MFDFKLLLYLITWLYHIVVNTCWMHSSLVLTHPDIQRNGYFVHCMFLSLLNHVLIVVSDKHHVSDPVKGSEVDCGVIHQYE